VDGAIAKPFQGGRRGRWGGKKEDRDIVGGIEEGAVQTKGNGIVV